MKQDTKRRVVMSAIPAEIYKLITKKLLHVNVMKDTTNYLIMSAVLVLTAVPSAVIMTNTIAMNA